MKKQKNKSQTVSLIRRLMALLYDILLVFSLLIMASLLYALIFGENSIKLNSNNFVFYQIYIFSIIIFYFIFSWLKGGQTLGMKSWNFKLVYEKENTTFIKIIILISRFILAILSFLFFGVGFLSAIFNNDKKTFYDIITKTKLVKIL